MSTINVDTISDAAGSGKPNFPNGLTGDGSSLSGISAFKPVAVTGTTPSLDVGTYNFFNQGTLTGDTTVSFASVPTDARWSYTFESPLATAYDLTVASAISSFSVSTEDLTPRGLFFKPDGTKMFVIGSSGDEVHEYGLSIAWDITTSRIAQSLSVAAQDITPTALSFKPDGTTMYVIGGSGQDVNEYSLSTAWDVSTASYVRLFSVAAQDSGPQSLFFKPDGTKMFVAGATNDNVYEYSLSTAWNVSTASYTQAFSTASQMYNPYGLTFKPDGTAMYVSGVSNNAVYEYSISTAWDVSTATYVRSFSVAPVTSPSDLAFKPDGSVMYVVLYGTDEVVAYSTATYYTMTTPASVQNPPTEAITNKRTTYEFTTSDGGTNVYLINEEVL